jgi:mxaC protein
MLSAAVRAAGALAVAASVVALAGPHRPEYTVERVGQGAEIVLLLDRSRSMDQGFAPGTPPPRNVGGTYSPEALAYYFSQSPGRLRDPKGKVARELLSAFVASRPNDRFALVAFSTLPMRVLDFTGKPDMVQAAIAAGNVGRGLSETNIGRALQVGIDLFRDRPYTGSRIVMLVSDGGDRITPDPRDLLTRAARRERVSIYWMFLRGSANVSLQATDAAEAQAGGAALGTGAADGLDVVPEVMMHRFLKTLDVPYRVYEAADTQALQRAIDDVNRLEQLPIAYQDLVPRRDFTALALGVALACALLLLGVNLKEIRRWA